MGAVEAMQKHFDNLCLEIVVVALNVGARSKHMSATLKCFGDTQHFDAAFAT